jgi:hypothetical protein
MFADMMRVLWQVAATRLLVLSGVLVALATFSGIGCGSRDPRDATDRNGAAASSPARPSGGQNGFEMAHDAAETEPRGVIVAPGGRRIARGTRDDLGYVLPLDVRRGKAPRSPGVRPPREAIDRARRGAAKSTFVDTRLGPDDGHTQNETSIAVIGDTLVAGWNNYTDTTLLMGVARSTDGGFSWTSSIIGGHAAMSDPTVMSNGAGAWYYGYIASGGPGGSDLDVFVQRSTDAGATWLAPVAVTSDANFDDKPYIDAGGSDVLVGYADFGFSPAKVRAARSTNGGASFGSDIVLANNSVGGNGACPVIDAAGNYYVFWRDSFQDSLWIAKSTDRGATWTPDRGIVAMNPLPSTLLGGFRIVNLPSADADPLPGTLVVVWNDQLFGNPDILSIRSTDGGATWSAPVRVNDDAGTAAQWFPWLTIDESGLVHVVWYDRRGNGLDIDVYYARSLDGGVTFEPNLRVTAAAFTAVLPWEGGAPDFIGDYNGIAAAAGIAYPFYQDSREGNQDVYVATIDATVVDVPGSSHEPSSQSFTLVATPNPFRSNVALQVATSAAPAFPSNATLQIVTAEGRLVRRIPLRDRDTAVWDGRDESGRSLPSGIYLARILDNARSSEATRLIKLD